MAVRTRAAPTGPDYEPVFGNVLLFHGIPSVFFSNHCGTEYFFVRVANRFDCGMSTLLC